MTELKKILDATTDVFKKEYATVCDSSGGITAKQNNLTKFEPINKKLVTAITKNTNDYLEQNPDKDRNTIIATGKEYVSSFQKQMVNPFS